MKQSRISRHLTKAMKNLQAQVPDLLLQEVKELAAHQGSSVDNLVAMALTAQVSAWRTRESIESRARRADWKHVDDILTRVPDAPPLSGDNIPK
jgi:hypothetical protein